jgi:hypothetical protein
MDPFRSISDRHRMSLSTLNSAEGRIRIAYVFQ